MFLSDNGACAEWEPFGFDLPPVPVNQVQSGVGINLGTQAAPNHLWKSSDFGNMSRAEGMISYGSAWANASNTPWRLYKHDCHEGGISGPLIVHWPTRIRRGGEFRRQVSHLIDIMPTCVEVAATNYPVENVGHTIVPLEGKSLVSSFDDGPIDHDLLAWEHEGNAAIRAGDWKLVRREAQGVWELYDLARDRTELNNLAGQQPERVEQLAATWQAWAERTHVFPKPGGNQGAKSK
jgi:arylsulfatase